ncbi:M4 family metallopeptidase [Umezawaea sp. Da 62-37]|uniref:M4 family metallopeptidase n=1 Tax=Umezawaea sp. Da 62-37 TaxID=3075927 RepID=UPI0028F734E8|nr:M4 family metallopeptidase [Umezawaea sp. Da 62-37]WNV87932.1 M4 family metallopeptidase [Umezawaea sp. Da 62-37]
MPHFTTHPSRVLSCLALAAVLCANGAPANAAPAFAVDRDADLVTAVRPVAAHPAGGDPATAADEHLPLVARGFDVNRSTLRQVSARVLDGGSAVRYRQEFSGVPVLGGEVVQLLDRSGALVSAQGRTARGTSGAFPAGDATDGGPITKAAVAATAERAGMDPTGLITSGARRGWYDAALFGEGGDGVARPAYVVPVRAAVDGRRWEVVVDAVDATALTAWEATEQVNNRVVCDAKRTEVATWFTTDERLRADVRCGTTFPATRTEDSPANGESDVDEVYDHLGRTSALYSRHLRVDLTTMLGVDVGDGNGKALRATVRLCSAEEGCPYANAFWDGEQMAFGEGVSTVDVTAHEVTHGVTQQISGLLYRGESGAINEAMSDIFGEFVDLTTPGKLAGTRWQIGDGSSLGVIRDMADPTKHRQPDQVDGKYWVSGADPHRNSGVANKAAFLIADGGSFGGETVSGLGLDKSVALWWAVQNQLTPASTFRDLGTALDTACALNSRAAVAGTTTGDCDQVRKAVRATRMAEVPKSGA